MLMMSPAIALVFLLLSPCVYARLDTQMPVIRQVRLPGTEVQKAAYSHVVLGRQSLPNSARVEIRTSLLLFRWHEAFQLFRPVQHDVDLRRRRLLAFDGPEHQEPLPIR
jgi:hypothetical protein